MRVPKPLLMLPAVLALVALLAACGSSKKTVPPTAIAVVGDQTITRAAYDEQLDMARKQAEANGQPFPKAGTQEYEAQKQRIVQTLVQQVMIDTEAEKLGVEVPESEIDKRIEQIKKESFDGSDAKLQAELKKRGLTMEYVRTSIRNQIVQDRLLKKITSEVKVTDADIKKHYDENQAEYTQPESREVAHILVKTKKLADELYTRLQNGENFAKLAKQYSEDPGSKPTGGKLIGGDTRGSFVPEFEQALFALETDKISQPVKTQFGWHIIKALGDTKPKHVSPLKDVSNAIEQQLQQQRESEAVQKWVDDVKKRYEKKTSYQIGFAPPATAATSG